MITLFCSYASISLPNHEQQWHVTHFSKASAQYDAWIKLDLWNCVLNRWVSQHQRVSFLLCYCLSRVGRGRSLARPDRDGGEVLFQGKWLPSSSHFHPLHISSWNSKVNESVYWNAISKAPVGFTHILPLP